MIAQKTKIKDHIVFWCTCLFYVLVFLFVVSSRTGNKLLKFKYTQLATLFLPSKWALYTRRTAIEKVTEVYSIENGKAMRIDNRPFCPTLLYGLKRDCKVVASETSIIVRDTAFQKAATMYIVSMPQNANINNYIKSDTLHYTDYRSKNTLYLKGRVLVTITEPETWQQARQKRWPSQKVTVIPVNIIRDK